MYQCVCVCVCVKLTNALAVLSSMCGRQIRDSTIPFLSEVLPPGVEDRGKQFARMSPRLQQHIRKLVPWSLGEDDIAPTPSARSSGVGGISGTRDTDSDSVSHEGFTDPNYASGE